MHYFLFFIFGAEIGTLNAFLDTADCSSSKLLGFNSSNIESFYFVCSPSVYVTSNKTLFSVYCCSYVVVTNRFALHLVLLSCLRTTSVYLYLYDTMYICGKFFCLCLSNGQNRNNQQQTFLPTKLYIDSFVVDCLWYLVLLLFGADINSIPVYHRLLLVWDRKWKNGEGTAVVGINWYQKTGCCLIFLALFSECI